MIFCTRCLTGNVDDATQCSGCGAGLPPAGQTSWGDELRQPFRTGVSVPNHMLFAVLVTMFCFLPTGIIAIVNATQVNNKLAVGDIAGAQQASKNVQMWCLISVGLGLVMFVGFALLFLFGMNGSPR
jgi:uncharacterized BrkB/YihY/UPF0761 family membrane protein